MPEYVFDNAGEQTSGRFSALETLFDAGTFRLMETMGVGAGWRCLEVGGGSGSVARWLGERVGPTGQVVSTDIDTRFLAQVDAPNVEVRHHDITRDDLEPNYYDFAHTRLVLLHIPERELAIERIIAALKPGGWVLFEEFDTVRFKPDPDVSPQEHMLKTLGVLWDAMTARGVNHGFGRLLPLVLESKGLVSVNADIRGSLFRGGSVGGDLLRANFEQMHDAILATGQITEEEFQADIARVGDPSVVWPSPLLWAVSGQKPGS